MNEEMKFVINKAFKEEFNRGRMQGVQEFYMMLRDTHKTPEEIRDFLFHNDVYDKGDCVCEWSE